MRRLTAVLTAIKTSINAVHEFVTSTTSAIDEQSAADGVSSISANINEISTAVEQAVQAISKTLEAALVLAR